MLYALNALCAVEFGIAAVTWWNVTANQLRTTHSIPHFTFRILQFRILPATTEDDVALRTSTQGRITRKVNQISVSKHISLGIELHSSEPENTALMVTNPTDSLKRNQDYLITVFKSKLSMQNYLDVPKILAVQEPAVKIISRVPATLVD